MKVMKRMKLSDACIGITDGSHNPPNGVEHSEYLMLSSKNINDDEITYDAPRYLTREDFDRENLRTNVSQGDVLLTIVGTVGRAAVVEDTEKIALQRSVAVLHPDKNLCISRYLMYWLMSKRQFFEQEARGVAQKGIYLNRLSNVEIFIRDMDGQKEIVKELDEIQKLVRLEKNQIESYDTLIKSRFVEMFGDVATGNYRYETRKLGDVADVGSSHRVFTTEFVDSGIPFYRGTEIGELANGIKPTEPYYISEEHYNRLAKDDTKPQIGDLLMPSICNKGQVWMVDTNEPFYYKDGRVLCISPNREIFDSKYLEYFMRVKTLVEYPKLGSGSTFAEFKIFLLKDIDALIPPIELQEQFATFVHQVDKLKSVTQKALEETQLLMDSLMQKYFG